VAHALRDYAGQLELDPRELERVQTRLAELERLQRKYGPDLLDHLQKVRREIDNIGLTEDKKEDLQGKLTALHRQYEKSASELSRRRRQATKTLESSVERELKSLAMPHARFVIRWEDVRPGRASGFDLPEFQISTNPGEEPMPLKSVAS